MVRQANVIPSSSKLNCSVCFWQYFSNLRVASTKFTAVALSSVIRRRPAIAMDRSIILSFIKTVASLIQTVSYRAPAQFRLEMPSRQLYSLPTSPGYFLYANIWLLLTAFAEKLKQLVVSVCPSVRPFVSTLFLNGLTFELQFFVCVMAIVHLGLKGSRS